MFFGAVMLKTNSAGFSFIKVLLLSMFGVMSFECAADTLDSDSGQSANGARLLYSGRKDYAQYDLIVGKMDYIEDVSSEGFKPAQIQPMVGTIDRRLYDYGKQKSAIEIYKNIVSTLERDKYRIVYQCSGVSCGGAAGWQLFLSKQLGGDDIYQHYVAAVKTDSSKHFQYFICYVNDLAGQPRALVDRVTVATDKVIGDVSLYTDLDSTRVGSSIYFEFGKAVLDNREEQLAKAKRLIVESGTHCPIRVIGYTDSVGTEAANKQLAKARVEEVIKYLRGSAELPSQCFVAEPRGIEIASNGEGLASSRRVDLVVPTQQ